MKGIKICRVCVRANNKTFSDVVLILFKTVNVKYYFSSFSRVFRQIYEMLIYQPKQMNIHCTCQNQLKSENVKNMT